MSQYPDFSPLILLGLTNAQALAFQVLLDRLTHDHELVMEDLTGLHLSMKVVMAKMDELFHRLDKTPGIVVPGNFRGHPYLTEADCLQKDPPAPKEPE